MMIKKLFTLFLLLIISQFCSASNQQVIYNVRIQLNNPLEAIVIADTRHLGAFALRPSRYIKRMSNGHKVIYCADNDKPITYGVKQRCNQIYWTINFKPEVSQGINASEQNSYYFDNAQWLLTEWNNMPRLLTDDQIIVCINNQDCQPLAATNELPSLWVWGRSPTSIRVSNFSINLYTDSFGDSLNKQKILQDLQPAFDYIASVFQQYKTSERWNLIWLKREIPTNSIGGSAARHGFLANYPLSKGKIFSQTVPMLIKISTHEFAHTVSSYQFPVWVSESLAEYYAYKALLKTGHLKITALENWQNRKKEYQYANTGLYKAAQYVNDGKRAYYTLFYAKGAAFWYEIDMLMQKNRSSLDYFIPLLAISSDDPDYLALPDLFMQRAMSVIENHAFNELARTYLN